LPARLRAALPSASGPVGSFGSTAPGLLAVLVFLLLARNQGGFFPTAWYPGAVFFLGLLAVTAVRARDFHTRATRSCRWAVGLFALFTLWSFVSISWADVKGDAWDGANRTLLYLAVFALFALWPWRLTGAIWVLAAWGVGVALVGAETLHAALTTSAPEDFFDSSRLSLPTGYPNATAALFLLALWPTLWLSTRREHPPLLRGLALAISGFLLQLGIIPESRGALFSVPITAVVYLGLVPGRRRSLLALGLVLAGTAPFLDPLRGVFQAGIEHRDVGRAVNEAVHGMAISFGALFAAGLIIAVLDVRLQLTSQMQKRLDRLLLVTAIGFASVLLAVTPLILGNPLNRLAAGWKDFTRASEPLSNSSRLVGLGSSRYDFWRVSLAMFRKRPIGGAGADNFAADYVRERRTSEQPLYPHSLEMRVLAGTGAVGATLFVAFLGCALAPLRSVVRSNTLRGAGAAAGVAGFFSWFIQGSVDWLWEFPGLAAPAIALLGLLSGLMAREPRVIERRGRRRRLLAAPFVAAVVAAAVLTLTLPWLAARDVEAALAGWKSAPLHSFSLLSRARMLNFLSDRPDVIAGVIAGRLSDYERMNTAFRAAVSRNPRNWYACLEIGILESLLGHNEIARAWVARAQRLNPSEPVISLVRERVDRGQRVSPREIDRLFGARMSSTGGDKLPDIREPPI